MNKLTKTIYIFFILLFSFGGVSYSQEDVNVNALSYEAVVKEVLEEKENDSGGYYQKLIVEVLSGDLVGEQVEIEHGLGNSPVTQRFTKGDRVVLAGYQEGSGNLALFIDDYVRRGPMLFLFFIFLVLALLVAGKRGFTSFVGMVITFLMIYWFVLPRLSAGSSPVFIVLVFSALAIPVTFYLSHGFNRKTNVAMAGTFIALIITVILSAIFVNSAKLTGFTTDEASFLQIIKGESFNMRGILLAGIIIGLLGVLDDITVSQASVVFQIKEANKRLGFGELYKRSMRVGKDHIASMINTLVLVYAGASLPLLLLFTDSSHTFRQVINYEIIASEVIRTLIGSIGLVLAVPVTTFIAASMADAEKEVKL
jgi:uncharacterized membrane protein